MMNAVTYKEIFPLIMQNRIWFGNSFNIPMYFITPDDYSIIGKGYTDADGTKHIRVQSLCWYTNLDIDKRNKKLTLTSEYHGHEGEYPKYDNYDAINVSKTSLIPQDYEGVMGVPITFLDKYNPDQFEIIGCSYSYGEPGNAHHDGEPYSPFINGKELYKRLFIRNKHPKPPLIM